jgi:hypothetical protein
MIGRAVSLFVDLFFLSFILWVFGHFANIELLVAPLLAWSYFSVCYIVFAQTLGYILVGYKVQVTDRSSSLNNSLKLILRAGLKTLCLGIFLPIIPVFGKGFENRSLVDMLCGTVVSESYGTRGRKFH